MPYLPPVAGLPGIGDGTPVWLRWREAEIALDVDPAGRLERE